MLTIRLQRTGKRNFATYRVVLAEKTAHVSKRFVEILGSYNPHTKELVVKNAERLQYWIGQHVAMSPTVNNLFVTKGVLQGDKVKAYRVPKKEVAAEEPKAEAPAAPEAQAEPQAEPAAETTEAAPEAPAEQA